MNLNVDATQDVLSNPTTSLKATLAGASNEAKEAIRSIMPESANGMLKDVLSTNTDGRKDTARLQVVDEVGCRSMLEGSRCRGDGACFISGPAFHVNALALLIWIRTVLIEDASFLRKQLPEYMLTWQLHNVGFNYSVVAVFGSQSTGKSTLLNRVFGTSFEVMNENERRQTTKGAW